MHATDRRNRLACYNQILHHPCSRIAIHYNIEYLFISESDEHKHVELTFLTLIIFFISQKKLTDTDF